MKITFSKIGAIAWYELKMQWRQRGTIVMMLSMLVATLAPIGFIMAESGGGNGGDGMALKSAISLTWSPIGIVLALLMPLLSAATIPRDRQLGVRELLDSTPLNYGTYLLGKVIGSWLAISVGIAGIALLAGIGWWLIIGSYNVLEYMEPWLVAALPIIMINIGIIILLAAHQSDGRHAVLVAIFFVVVLPMLLGLQSKGDWRDALNPLRPALFFEYIDVSTINETIQLKLLPISTTILTGFVQLGVVGIGAWGWQRLKERP